MPSQLNPHSSFIISVFCQSGVAYVFSKSLVGFCPVVKLEKIAYLMDRWTEAITIILAFLLKKHEDAWYNVAKSENLDLWDFKLM